MMESHPYYIGAPLWALKEWKGSFFTKDAKPAEFLAQYAQFFNAVEGNTTFYSVPSEKMVDRWLESTPDTFRFSFKFPRTITHYQKLQNCDAEVTEFLTRLAPLGERLNNFMIQLPGSFSPAMISVLERFLRKLPGDYGYSVEVRHADFFTQQHIRENYNSLLHELGVDRIIFESRPVRAAPALDQATQEAHERKPRLPVQLDSTAQSPVLRYIGHPVMEENAKWLEPWAAQTIRWIEAGLTPRIFLHTPNNQQVPELARTFNHYIQTRLSGVPDLPAFPGAPKSGLLL
uniref:DUF72 domain-containing protein n=1 Tax=uncultured Thiotrichaceae bacterium TaxID=298394 RepID=A0A6S6UK04_9GAMM|nr:MAG: FIG003003: hypothetical protein [uncultured Thiotrichaceae bacterium]